MGCSASKIYTAWFKKMDSISYVYISWTIHSMWMVYIKFERGGLTFSNTTGRALPNVKPCSRVSWEQNGYYAAQERSPGASILDPKPPDLTPCDFFLWGSVKESVYVPDLPTNLDDLKNHITTAVNSVTQDILLRVWNEFSYRLDVTRAAGGGAHWTFINFIVSIIKCNLHHICL